MVAQNIYYQEEKKYVANKLTILFIITFFSFAINTEIFSQILLIRLVLGGLVLITMLHYILIVRYADTLTVYRKNISILLDLTILTFLIMLLEKNGLFFFPFYIIIVMQSGLSFGIQYFYVSIFSAIISWILLLIYSEYWSVHYDIIATFAMAALLIPLFYLNFITRVHEQNDKLSERLSETEHDANHDPLTGIANRKVYKEVMQNRLKEKEFFALLFIDLNKFKAVNDTHGHHIGDGVLIEVTKRLIKSIDSNDFLARLGGDEFVIISKRKKVFLAKFVENLEKNVIGRHTVHGVEIYIEMSIGISLYPDDSSNELLLGKYADEAMYVAKKKSNIHHMFYSDINLTLH